MTSDSSFSSKKEKKKSTLLEILNSYLFMNLNLGNSPFLIHRDAVRIQRKGEMLESLRQESQIHT